MQTNLKIQFLKQDISSLSQALELSQSSSIRMQDRNVKSALSWVPNIIDQIQLIMQGSSFKLATLKSARKQEYVIDSKYSSNLVNRTPFFKEDKCNICLGPHKTYACTDSLCYRCGAPKHHIQDCWTHLGAPFCQRCGRHGHLHQQCGQILPSRLNKQSKTVIEKQTNEKCSDVNFDNEEGFLESNKQIKDEMDLVICLKCNKSGHANCHKYQNVEMDVYENS